MALIVVKKEKVVEFELDKKAVQKIIKKVLQENRLIKNQQPKKAVSHFVANF